MSVGKPNFYDGDGLRDDDPDLMFLAAETGFSEKAQVNVSSYDGRCTSPTV